MTKGQLVEYAEANNIVVDLTWSKKRIEEKIQKDIVSNKEGASNVSPLNAESDRMVILDKKGEKYFQEIENKLSVYGAYIVDKKLYPYKTKYNEDPKSFTKKHNKKDIIRNVVREIEKDEYVKDPSKLKGRKIAVGIFSPWIIIGAPIMILIGAIFFAIGAVAPLLSLGAAISADYLEPFNSSIEVLKYLMYGVTGLALMIPFMAVGWVLIKTGVVLLRLFAWAGGKPVRSPKLFRRKMSISSIVIITFIAIALIAMAAASAYLVLMSRDAHNISYLDAFGLEYR